MIIIESVHQLMQLVQQHHRSDCPAQRTQWLAYGIALRRAAAIGSPLALTQPIYQ